MRALNPTTQSALDDGRIVAVDMILFEFPSGNYGFWRGEGILTYNTVPYIGGGSLIDIGDVEQGSDLSANSLTLKLRGVPNTDLTPDTLATIESEQYHQKPVNLYVGFFNHETRVLMSVEVRYRGYVDQVFHKDEVNESGENTAVLEIRCESRFRDHQKSGYRIRSDLDQRLIYPTDDFYRNVSTVANDKILFGRVEQQAAPPAKKKSFWEKLFG